MRIGLGEGLGYPEIALFWCPERSQAIGKTGAANLTAMMVYGIGELSG
jgi:hypothetical protein